MTNVTLFILYKKIILKEIHKERSAVDKLLNEQLQLDLGDLDDFTKQLYGDLDALKDEKEVTANQRFEKIIRLIICIRLNIKNT